MKNSSKLFVFNMFVLWRYVGTPPTHTYTLHLIDNTAMQPGIPHQLKQTKAFTLGV
jgi:hypothetical protein